MKIVIDIDEEDYKQIKHDSYYSFDKYVAYIAIKNGTPLPENHGRLIDADAYINKHGAFGWLEDIEIDDFNEITPTIIEGE